MTTSQQYALHWALKTRQEWIDKGWTVEQADARAITDCTSLLFREYYCSLVCEHEMADPGSDEEAELEAILDTGYAQVQREVAQLWAEHWQIEHLNNCWQL